MFAKLLRNFRKGILTCAVAAPLPLFSQNLVEIDVDADFDPVSAVGLVISSKGTSQKQIIKIERENGRLVVSFKVDKPDIKDDSVATALVVSENGDLGFGSLKPLFNSSSLDSLFSLPDCPLEEVPVENLKDQVGTLETLVGGRFARRGLAQLKVSRVMEPEFLTKLQKLEKGFGLSRSKQLSPDVNPTELIDRLSRILQAIKNVRSSKKKEPESESR